VARKQARAAQADGRSIGQTVVHSLDDAGHAVAKVAGRAREGAEDIWAEARQSAGDDSGRDAAVYLGIGATVALGAVELPVAAAIGAAYAIFRRR
jgi:hypothetical protein